jgi:solute carrier family 25 S-adenosylmethionine transporter 26
MEKEPSFLKSLICGGIAGTMVDVALFPLDTLKTRLQSSQGFLKSGGFRGVYKGLSITAIGSAPGAALFFSSYEKSKQQLSSHTKLSPVSIHMTAACIGETVSYCPL